MNKYEKAFNHLREHASFDTVDEMIDIKELVEKDVFSSFTNDYLIYISRVHYGLDKDSIKYKKETDKLTIEVLSSDEKVTLTIENMLMMLEELASTYKKNIKIIKEEI